MRVSLLFLLLLAPSAQAVPPAPFAGQYGHGATADSDEVVWSVQGEAPSWRLTRTADDEQVDAQRMRARGREAFWTRMDWPVDSSTDADCLTWGEKPASLQDLLADTPPAPLAAGDDYGLGVLCHVPAPARSRIDWLAGNASDWFYYDPVAGVMEVRRLR
ncbi:hypothetical protein MMG85_06840 [Pseudoxanthomonas sp. LH2527]|uniref:hypothetical protein n=1 Tax=Pseudoxanthomonas sp. LH2527 TaxID=2923249 RepID=UPI001F1324CB|nr:hypothetical protein [Pseudoxanthomonas sp. LH2527]MCH6483282.1 hypothetical protein [Pseudoxanthomonas sp. LH2527]